MRLDIGRPIVAQSASGSISSTYTLGPRVTPLGCHDAIRSIGRGGCHATQSIFRLAQ